MGNDIRKVCIINTGGTIGMLPTEDGYATNDDYMREVLPQVLGPKEGSGDLPAWELVQLPQLLDSSNVSINEWRIIAGLIRDNYDSFDGFVILHGTDTMAYTASALSFMLENLGKPVILTGSQIPLFRVRSDARENLITSCIIAAEGKCPEVCLFFGGKLLRGNRATKASSDQLIAFESPNLPPLAEAAINIQYDTHLIRRPELGEKFRVSEFKEDVPVAVLKIFPGIQYELFDGILTDRLKGLVLEAFGAGNIPTGSDGLLHVVEEAAANGTVIVVCTQCLRGSVLLGAYEASAPLIKAGAVSGLDITPEAAVTKLYHLFSKGLTSEQVREEMGKSLRGEMGGA